MEVSFILGFVLMWTAVFIARNISVKEIQKLSVEKKAELVDLGTGRRSMQLAILIVGIAAFYLITYFIDDHRDVWFGMYALFILVWLIFRTFKALQTFRSKGFSEEFVKAQLNAGIIRLIGIVAFFACVGLNFVFY